MPNIEGMRNRDLRPLIYDSVDLAVITRDDIIRCERLSIFLTSRLENWRCFVAGKRFHALKPYAGQLTGSLLAPPSATCGHFSEHPEHAETFPVTLPNYVGNGASVASTDPRAKMFGIECPDRQRRSAGFP